MELVMLLMLKAVTLQVTARKELKLVLPNRSWEKKKLGEKDFISLAILHANHLALVELKVSVTILIRELIMLVK